jgi:hypothetical protein
MSPVAFVRVAIERRSHQRLVLPLQFVECPPQFFEFPDPW